jgi:hypothetical protein
MNNPEQSTTVNYFNAAAAAWKPGPPLTGDCETRVARLAEEMAQAWRRGERPGIEEFLARSPELAEVPAAVLDLLYEEICLRSRRWAAGRSS